MLIFWSIAVVALALLVLTALIGDFLDGVLDTIDFTDGYLSSTAILAFFATFGLTGGLLLSQSDVSTLLASVAATAVGLAVGAGAAFASRALSRTPTAHQITAADYLDQLATVVVSIPADGMGQVHLTLAGQPTSIAARAAEPIATGAAVRIVSLLGPGVVNVAREA